MLSGFIRGLNMILIGKALISLRVLHMFQLVFMQMRTNINIHLSSECNAYGIIEPFK